MESTPNLTLELKTQVILALMQQAEREISELSTDEKERLKAIDPDDEDTHHAYESTKEELVGEITRENATIEHAEERLAKLRAMPAKRALDEVGPGALVRMNTGCFLVGVSFSPSQVAGETVTGITIDSPIYEKMQGLKVGAEFHLTGGKQEFVILGVV
ncbi:MAG TPA: hypothetical protein DCE41_11035 [Cytophagales bacterium]|nr:hypothetical protein [Cytophagales bacterium]HAA17507.1 hypothetical protein [Cytophagales bacterium]HAP63433.1 hypothetical protein [Cytophagales bacterium]